MEHLIDRENELQILRRLGKKNIGPRVLGTFNNGRFEEYFHARTLTPKDLRNPETSKQIAKRMRELHDGIELLEEERQGGPFVWKNWNKWVDRCEQVITWLDKEIMSGQGEEPWMKRGFVCGVPWPQFRKTVDSYRKWLHASYGGTNAIRQQLVFAHNDVSTRFLNYCIEVTNLCRPNTVIFFALSLAESRLSCFRPMNISSSLSSTSSMPLPTSVVWNLRTTL